MDSGLQAGMARVAMVLRLVGAVWVVLLLAAAAYAGQLTAATASTVTCAVAVAWAVALWRGAWLEEEAPPAWLAVADVTVACGVVVAPGLAGETAGISGGYPFASLLVALAVAGPRGVVASAAALAVATLVTLGAVGRASLAFVASNLLLYVLGAVALVVGAGVLQRQQEQARTTQAELAVARERAATAAHLHDSVLQTLALVQRRADDAGAVRSLARRQERELREWLFPSAQPGAATGLAQALATVAETVQERFDVAVRVVTVGGAGEVAVAGPVEALLGATREAVVNAAQHAGVQQVDVFAQREGDGLAVWVRDRGEGFELASVPPDRHGVRGSILGRMEAAGGTAQVRSGPGQGTEVELRLMQMEVGHG